MGLDLSLGELLSYPVSRSSLSGSESALLAASEFPETLIALAVTMRPKLMWAGIGVLSWILLGIVLSLIGGSIVGYSQSEGLIRYGATVGAAIGLFYSGGALLTSLAVGSRRIMPWMIGISLISAIVCFFAAIWLGGYPKESEADLSFILIAPVSIAFGGLLGSGLGVAMWRSRVGL